MVIERAELEIKAGEEEAFEAAVKDAIGYLKDAAGSQKVTLGRGVESPSKYVLLIEWDAVDSHIEFTKTEEFGKFGGAVGGFFAGPPAMEHFAPVG